MLCHQSSGGVNTGAADFASRISWGLSPTSRKQVDGFLRLPSFDDALSWIKFIDWRNQGCLRIHDVAAVLAAIAPRSLLVNHVQCASEGQQQQQQQRVQCASEGVISDGQLATTVLPLLQRYYLERLEKEKHASSALSQLACG